MAEPLTPEAEHLHEWLCSRARFTTTGKFGVALRERLAAVEDAARAALATPAPLDDFTPTLGPIDDVISAVTRDGRDTPARRTLIALRAAIVNVVANRASPPEYPGLALVPVRDLDQLAGFLDARLASKGRLGMTDTDRLDALAAAATRASGRLNDYLSTLPAGTGRTQALVDVNAILTYQRAAVRDLDELRAGINKAIDYIEAGTPLAREAGLATLRSMAALHREDGA